MQITDERRDDKYEMMRMGGGSSYDKGEVFVVRKKRDTARYRYQGTQREGGCVGDSQKVYLKTSR